ncbi:MAG: prepilin-type N-terminal cleavage/methylation domain-containing protein [Geminicoccaceae bacterium]|nr:prepilin-type N-terminal cleavage/methylation domain-containing protein [Geminicoccaceae bacterium]
MTVPDRPAATGAAGLTLLELLIALAVLALAAAIAAGGLGVLGRALERERRAQGETEPAATAVGLLRNELARALPLDWGPPQRPIMAFEGSAERIRFVNAPTDDRLGGGLALWELALEDVRGGRRLLARRAALVRDGSGFARLATVEPVPLVVLDGDASFAFWGRPDGSGEPRWWPRWPPGPRLPEAVRLAGARPDGPATIVRLAIDLPLFCLGDRRGGVACG